MGRSYFLLGKAVFLFAIGSSVAGLFSQNAQAYTPTLTTSGAPVRWPGMPIQFELTGNSRNLTQINDSEFYASVVRGLQRWSYASGGSLRFNYWQGTDSNIYRPTSAYDGYSSIYFSSSAKADPHLSSNVLGLTQVWYDASSGRILETDIALNDRDFYFTTHARDTSGYGSGSSSYANGRSNVFIENVITHELGHAFGLSHSGGLQSTMLFMESPEQAHLSCDEAIAIHALYPSSDQNLRGSLQGQITTPSGNAVVGAHVVAISRRRGNVLATALSDSNGHYTIEALEPGNYFLLAEPFYAGPQTLPSYYSGMRPDVCPNHRFFGRTLLLDSTGSRPSPIEVMGGQVTNAPPLSVQCRAEGGATISMQPSASTLQSAPILYPRSPGDTGFGATDILSMSTPHYYKLEGIQGHLEIHALTYSLYSPARSMLTLLDTSGNKVSTTTFDNVYQGESGYVNFDSALYADPLPFGDYYLKVSSTELDMNLYPAGPIAIDSIPFLILSGSINEVTPPLSESLANNARCQMEEDFPSYTSPPGNPPRHLEESEKSTGFCSTLQESKSRPGNPDSDNGPSATAIIGWFLPFLTLGFIARALRRTNPLSPLRTPRDMRQSMT